MNVLVHTKVTGVTPQHACPAGAAGGGRLLRGDAGTTELLAEPARCEGVRPD